MLAGEAGRGSSESQGSGEHFSCKALPMLSVPAKRPFPSPRFRGVIVNYSWVIPSGFSESPYSRPFSLHRALQESRSHLSNGPSGAVFPHGRGCIAEVKEHPPSSGLVIKHSIWPTFYRELSEPLG